MWYGIVLMLAMAVGLIWWMVWAMKKDKEKSK